MSSAPGAPAPEGSTSGGPAPAPPAPGTGVDTGETVELAAVPAQEQPAQEAGKLEGEERGSGLKEQVAALKGHAAGLKEQAAGLKEQAGTLKTRSSGLKEGASGAVVRDDRPEVAVGGAFAGGLVLAMILRRLRS